MDYSYQQPQSKNKVTTIQSIVQQQENMDLCSCGSEEKVMFHCDNQSCPNFENQKLFCPECLIPEKHPHIPVLIAKKSKNVTEEWNNLRQELKILNQIISDWIQSYGPIVQLLDRYKANGQSTFQQNLSAFSNLNREVENFYELQVSESSAKGEILKLQTLRPKFLQFKERLITLEFLNKIGPSVMWQVYSDILHLVDQQEILENFSQPNIEIFLILKLLKVQISLAEVHFGKQNKVYVHQMLEDPNLTTTNFIQSMQEQIQQLSLKPEMPVSDEIKMNGIRSELEAIKVSLMFAKLIGRVKIAELKNQSLEKRLTQFEQNQNQGMNDARLEEMKEQVKIERQILQNEIECARHRVSFSSIITTEEKLNKLKAFFVQSGSPLVYSSLKYRGSQDTFLSAAFHRLCDSVLGSLTIIRTTDGKIIGGFTTKGWNGIDNYKKDSKAWLFNLDAQEIFKIKPTGENTAVYARSVQGPIFGQTQNRIWNDLYIADQCNLPNKNSAYIGGSYDYNGNANIFMTQAKVDFTVSEIEVYEV
ncbi:hypothetical protein FGO68_gene10577 [Halteria grandinella]|uniref:TLDc domain-containing protein n=1 Tax=Halteria grandinella TaxID=5974 RepID=A0A8J8NSN3_HALGN|nr:hypothetical protein FGO68_gene10577 [Halteria grandinella]